MFNNFTCEKEYECCNIVLPESEGRGALLIGDFNAATDQAVIRKHSISTIITAAAGLEHLQIPNCVTHIVYPLKDAKSENIRAFFDESFLTIDRKLNEGGVLVHCAAGVSRSATIVIAYLMRKNQISFKSAISTVKSKRSGICPNLGFELQLKNYESELSLSLPTKSKPQFLNKKTMSQKYPNQNMNQNLNQHPYQHPYQNEHKLQNNSCFDFQPERPEVKNLTKKKAEIKKGITRHTGYSRPKDKPLYDVMETQLFISGKSAKRPSSQVREGTTNYNSNRKNPLMGTWGAMTHKSKQFEI